MNQYQEAEVRNEQMVFTLAERVELRYTDKQAFEQAAMVYRTRRDLSRRQLFAPGTYNTFDKKKVHTAAGFSRRVNQILNDLSRSDW